MFSRRRQHKVPKVPVRDGLTLLLDQAAVPLAAHGTVRSPAGPWIAAARVLLVTRQSCGWDMEHTPETLLEPLLAHRGWAFSWEGADLVLTLPGWVEPTPVIVAIQDRLLH
jgi:hypothetical protein